ncbi:quinone oxidoreductase [Talaromyces proteolyticus]|uniref:Quinone oxidoreductase n=1 Tax=Talaromyces proteolyticus TaxID=1131652 RepID=A0AAD4Q6B3_9EURO|nr:quinone oxidoreductase [Talaromyces proteolyticus]KAH8705521.1 quinone oxidoreductase [Talaromyces proteolyticus]
MEAVQITNFVSSISEIQPSIIPRPRNPQRGEVLIRVHYAAVNYVDLLYAKGKHQNNRTLIQPPFTLGLEFSGVIVSLGIIDDQKEEHDNALKIGDHVFGSGIGAYAEFILVSKRAIRRVPQGWSLGDAATLAATATVAYGAISARAQAKKGEIALIHGAAGGIGAYACQIAKALGLRVIAGVRNKGDDDKMRFLTDLECVDGIVQTSQDGRWEDEVMNMTSGNGVDIVIDTVGLVRRSIRTLKPLGGRIVVVGFAGRDDKSIESIPMNAVLLRQAQLLGYRYGATDRINPEETRQIHDGLMSLIEKGLIKPVTYKRNYSGIHDITQALLDLESRETWGKIVVSITPDELKASL